MQKIRILTSTSLFDGHDASINIMRRVLQEQGAEVIHMGHNRSAQEIVEAAIEDLDNKNVKLFRDPYFFLPENQVFIMKDDAESTATVCRFIEKYLEYVKKNLLGKKGKSEIYVDFQFQCKQPREPCQMIVSFPK